ncbi:MAG: hypothetical protein J4473_05755 [Candidatus Aenigmarchaeota archaeon]|nr:hypothetical protein [Candidatus Aenigmarchaeota archaeon]
MPRIPSWQYRVYKEEETWSSTARTIYEKLARGAGRILNIEPDEHTSKTLKDAIEFSHMKISPGDVTSLTLLTIFSILIPTMVLILLNLWFGLPGLEIGNGVLIIGLSIPFALFIYFYPLYQKRRYEMKAGSDIINTILYMSIYMRNVPNIENAVEFASKNVTGPMMYELRKLMWDVQTGTYTNIYEALTTFAGKWKNNREFIEAIELMQASLQQTGQKRMDMIDEAVNVILDGSRENAKHYVEKLRMPIMVIHAMGIILPVMGLVMFPIVSVFLGTDPVFLFVAYDVLLPIALFFIIQEVMKLRPATFSQINIENSPDIPPKGKYPVIIGGKKYMIPLKYVAITITIIISGIGMMLPRDIYSALIILAGLSIGPGIYFILSSAPRLDIRQKVRNIELEFTEALFQLGNRISTGAPIEIALEGSMRRIRNLKIRSLFQRALENMRNFGMTFQTAFLDEKRGAVIFYPSELVRSIMKIVSESGKKGVNSASIAMMSISRYLKGLHQTQEEVDEKLGEVISSLQFQAYFLSPMISGIISTLAIIIIEILSMISAKLTSLGGMGSMGFLSSFSNLRISEFEFVLIVGIYLIETSLILARFLNWIENGDDPIGFQYRAGAILLVGFFVFVITLLITLALFEPMIKSTVL